MKDDFERLRRQNKRIITFLVILLLVNAIFLVIYFGKKSPHISNYVTTPGIVGAQGKPGEDGRTPVKGVDYFDGERGPMGKTGPRGPQGAQGAQGEPGLVGVTGPQGVQGEQGLKGDTGEAGPPGRELEIRCNPETQTFETHYKGDEAWTPMEGSDCVADNPTPPQ